jgi:hypothetical protein
MYQKVKGESRKFLKWEVTGSGGEIQLELFIWKGNWLEANGYLYFLEADGYLYLLEADGYLNLLIGS